MKKKSLLLIIISIYIIVPLIILINNKLYNYKFYILTIIGILVYLIMRLNKITNNELGINTNIKSSIKNNLPIILLFCVIILLLKIFGVNKYNPNESIYFYLFYIFISCPIQEFLYRGTFGYFDKLHNKKYLYLMLSSLCYSYVHIIYKDLLTLVLTFIFGIVSYLIYKKDYNLFGISLTHIILGILTISLGIIN